MFKNFVKKWPFFFLAIILGLLFVPLIMHSTLLWQNGAADNAFLAELTQEMGSSGKPTSGVAYAVDRAFATLYIVPPTAAELCALPLTEVFTETFNYFNWHTYFGLYFIAPLTHIVPAKILLPILNALSHFAFLLCIIFFFAKRKAPPLLCLFGVLLAVLHPAWSDGLQGQVYVDRFIYPLSFLYLLLLTSEKRNFRGIVIVAILMSLLSDRFGITVMLITMGYLAAEFLSHKSVFKIAKQWPVFLVGASCAVFSVVIIKLFINHPSYASFGTQFTIANIKNNWSIDIFRENTWKFVLMNFICFLPILIFSRYSLIAFGLMLINLIINIGGAEKTGYATHYHANYYPILIFAISDGLIRAYQDWTPRKTASAMAVFAGFLLVIPYSSTAGAKFFWDGTKLPLYTLYHRVFAKEDLKRKENFDLLLTQIPRGSYVSAPEPLMPTLVFHSKLQYFPVGIASAQYVIIPTGSFDLTENENAPLDPAKPGMAVMYRGREEELKANRCLSKKLVNLGYKETFKTPDWMILKKTGLPPN